MLDVIFLLDKVGGISGVLGAVLVGQIKKSGYLWFMVCNLAFGTMGYLQGSWGLIIVSVVSFVIDVYFYYKWKERDDALCTK